MSFPYGLIIKLPTNEKLQSTESFCFSILTVYAYVQAKNNILSYLTDWSTWIGILWKWASTLNELARDGECRLAGFHAIKNFLENKFFTFQGWPTKQAAFLLGLPAPYNQFLLQPLILVPEYYFQARVLKF